MAPPPTYNASPATMAASTSSPSHPSPPSSPTAPTSNPWTSPPTIPTAASLLNLAALNLSSNHLSGAIPPKLGLLARFCTFDIPNNCLSVSVPATLRFNASSFQGNKGVYGHPLLPVKNKGKPIAAIVGIRPSSLLFGLAIVCVCLRATDSSCGNGEEYGEEGKMSQFMQEC